MSSRVTRAIGRDAVVGAAALALAGAYGYLAQGIPQSLLADSVGAAGLPTLDAVVLALLALVLIARSLAARAADPESAVRGAAGRGSHLRALGLLLPGIAYLLLIGSLGYFATVLLLILGVALYAGARPGVGLFATGVVGASVMWATFVVLFAIPLPSGSLWPRLFG